MNAVGFAGRSLVRQPARATLGVLGVAAVGALLFDMLLLSNGLVVSMRDLLDQTGFDVRVTATGELPRRGPRIVRASAAARAIAALPSVRSAIAVRFADARIDRAGAATLYAVLEGVSEGGTRPWTVIAGRDVRNVREVVINETGARSLGLGPGSELTLRAGCVEGEEVLPPVDLHVAGVADFPFEVSSEITVAGTLGAVARACGGNAEDQADLILAVSQGDAVETAAAIQTLRPDLRVATNEELIGQFQQSGFTYFRQISTVLTTVTVSFALLLITVLLTVSVNQRLGEIAALRALGFSRRRVVADVLSESALIVGTGGLCSLPLGALLAIWLDTILKRMPGIPSEMHFFVFERRALIVHVALLAATALFAALYPMRIVARLPIAATLRNEVIS